MCHGVLAQAGNAGSIDVGGKFVLNSLGVDESKFTQDITILVAMCGGSLLLLMAAAQIKIHRALSAGPLPRCFRWRYNTAIHFPCFPRYWPRLRPGLKDSEANCVDLAEMI